MINLKNNSKNPIAATTGHVIMPSAAIEIDQQTMDRFLSDAYMSGQIKRGNLVASDAPESADAEVTNDRKWVAKALKVDLVALIDQETDFDREELQKMKVDDLRDIAVGLVSTADE